MAWVYFFLFHGLPFCFVSYFFCSVQKLFSLVCFPLPVLLVSYQKSYCHGLCQDFPCFLLRAFQFQVLHSSSPLSTGLWFKICSECLKPQIVSNSIYTVIFPKHTCLGWGDPLEEGMVTHSSILAWRIPWTKEPGGLESIASHRVGYYY